MNLTKAHAKHPFGIHTVTLSLHQKIIYWRTSLVPAVVVIPAPVAYIKVVAVKRLIVGFRWHVIYHIDSYAVSPFGSLVDIFPKHH